MAINRTLKGRGTTYKPPNRFEATHTEDDFEQIEADDELLEPRKVATEFLADESRSIITENDSPDIPFRYSINPYRGCEHGCAYCYARPYHEFLGLNAGLDFETRILVKHDAADRLRVELNRPSWRCAALAISGVTDCYQPAERRFKITRSLLEVLHEGHHPAAIVTKNALVVRDLDFVAPMAERNLIRVFVSITTLDQQLARRMEPRTAAPAARLKTVHELSAAGVSVGVMVAPIIPGLNDEEVPEILAAASEAGAVSASYVLLRLPLAVKPIFRDWLARNCPDKQDRIEGLIRTTREGDLSDPRFGSRMRGKGAYAEQIANTFAVFKRKHALDRPLEPLDTTRFIPPHPASGQLSLF